MGLLKVQFVAKVQKMKRDSLEITNVLTSLFDDIQEAKIETSTQSTKERPSEAALYDDEVLIALDEKKLYTNIPVEEAIDKAADLIYEQEKQREIVRSTFKALMILTVTSFPSCRMGNRFIRLMR